MLKIRVNDEIREVPEFYKEMTVEFFSGYWKIVSKNQEKEDDTIEQRIFRETKLTEMLVGYMLGLSEEETKLIDIVQAGAVIDCINRGIASEKSSEYQMDKFNWKGNTYYFPKDLMRGSTFGEYAEVKQIEQIFEKDGSNKFDFIKRQMAILCRKKGEKYESYDLNEREKEFKGLTMDVVMGFSFFLSKRILKYQRDFQIFSKGEKQIEHTKR